MKNTMGEKWVLAVAGGIALGIGLLVGFSPVAFYASSEIELGHSASLLSEIRAPAMVLIVFGLAMLAAVGVPKIRAAVLVAAAMLYLSYGIGRLISMAMDGMPHSNLLVAMALEVGVGLLCAFAYWRHVKPA
ncbi:DUF4345 domain-containing protein [Parasedimentitalea huanghaiensis]|uniref:DUF4345 domain-containing protein n=1 Tax=Parasedimentitalea huanghaiensis TaxID=2682100 RepID=A0A6L6WHA7_9RHOB|nr:DUF4345 domain-containing protein [Zongyanglinia huanghaiensis]MVO15072.1 DUF4345 domain-containing protein [Zongyanglinia huanghaiensis]